MFRARLLLISAAFSPLLVRQSSSTIYASVLTICMLVYSYVQDKVEIVYDRIEDMRIDASKIRPNMQKKNKDKDLDM